MKKILSIIAGAILIMDLVYGFITNQEVGSFFGFELDIWIHRLLLSALLILVSWEYYRTVKSKNRDSSN